MLPSSKPALYIRRGDNKFGPFTSNQVLKGVAEKKLLEADLIGESFEGPWISIATHCARQDVARQPPSPQEQPEQRQDSIQQGKRPPIRENAKADAMAPTSPAARDRGFSTSPSSWKYAIVGVLALSALGVLGIIGLSLLFVVTMFAFATRGDVAQTASPDNANQGSEMSSDPASQNSETPNEAGFGETQSTDEFLKILGDVQATLDNANRQAEGNASEQSAGVTSPADPDSSELREELLALSSEEATNLAMKYLSPAARADNGRTAFLLLEKASNAGHGQAMYFLFVCYLKGIGHPEDNAKALQWLQKSAESGDPIGMYAFSTAIRQGEYEGLDESQAQLWLDRSASLGHQPAINEQEGIRARKLAGNLGSFFSGRGSDDDADAPEHACDGAAGLFDRCDCQGFVQGGGTSDDPDPFLCKSCGHRKADHYR
jgi:hypothetical protein